MEEINYDSPIRLYTVTMPYKPEYLDLIKRDGTIRQPGDPEPPTAFRFHLSELGLKELGLKHKTGFSSVKIEFDACSAGPPVMTLTYGDPDDLRSF